MFFHFPFKIFSFKFIIRTIFIWTALGLNSNAVAQPNKNPAELQVKKVVMMLNIVAKEYSLAIKDGTVINTVEYNESQEFLKQAFERYQTLVKSALPSEMRSLNAEFESLTRLIQSKKDPGEVTIISKGLQKKIIKDFGIEFKISPKHPISLEKGEIIYRANCKKCHGAEGKGDGPLASQLDPAPAVLADPEITGNEHSTPYDNFEVINVGIANTSMIGWADSLNEEQIWNVAYFIRTFSNAEVNLPQPVAVDSQKDSSMESAVSKIHELLDQSLAAFRDKNVSESDELAFDAYLIYEKVESALAAKDKELGKQLEAGFSSLRGKIKGGATENQLENHIKGIYSSLDQGIQVLKVETGEVGLFIQSTSIIVREGFEAILILAALIAFLIKSHNESQVKMIYIGAGIGVLASIATAYVFHKILKVSTANQEMMEGIVMLVAVALLFYISYWLISKIGAQKFQEYVNIKLRQAISAGSAYTLAMLAFLSVYREGFETVLFYQALYTYAGGITNSIISGFVAGCASLGIIFYLINKLGLRIPVRWFFAITGVFLYYMAFTFMGKGLHALQVGGSLSLTPAEFVPQITSLGIYATWETFIGQAFLVFAYVLALIYSFGIKQEQSKN